MAAPAGEVLCTSTALSLGCLNTATVFVDWTDEHGRHIQWLCPTCSSIAIATHGGQALEVGRRPIRHLHSVN